MSLFTTIQSAVRKYKAKRVNAALNEYFSFIEKKVMEDVPVVLAVYNNIARDIVDLTERDAQPLLDLVQASERAMQYYGPTIKGQLLAAAEALEERSPEVALQFARMKAAWSAVGADVRTANEATRSPAHEAAPAAEPVTA